MSMLGFFHFSRISDKKPQNLDPRRFTLNLVPLREVINLNPTLKSHLSDEQLSNSFLSNFIFYFISSHNLENTKFIYILKQKNI